MRRTRRICDNERGLQISDGNNVRIGSSPPPRAHNSPACSVYRLRGLPCCLRLHSLHLSDQMFGDTPQLLSAQTQQISAIPRNQKTKMHTSHTIVSQHRQRQVSDWLAEQQDFVAA